MQLRLEGRLVDRLPWLGWLQQAGERGGCERAGVAGWGHSCLLAAPPSSERATKIIIKRIPLADAVKKCGSALLKGEKKTPSKRGFRMIM